jgi:hypothetical protein
MILSKARATVVAVAASASIAVASLAPASSQAYSTVRPIGIAEAATCTYAGQTYSQGSVVKQDDGQLHECMSNGAWSAGHKNRSHHR